MSKVKKEVRNWAKTIGPNKAKRALILAGLGISVAEKLCNGTYHADPKEDTIDKIYQAMLDQTEAKHE